LGQVGILGPEDFEEEEMEDPKPTIGRIVHYRLIDAGDAGDPVAACVVGVRKSDPEVLDLHVMYPTHKTAEGELVRGGCHNAGGVKKGGGAGQWGWPPRV